MSFVGNVRDLLGRFLRDERKLWKAFVSYGLVYAALVPVVALAVQGVVSNLAFINMGINLFSVLIGLGVILAMIQLCRYGQILLAEFLERRLVDHLVPRFEKVSADQKAIFFEVALIPKSLSKWAIEGLELALVLLTAPLMLMVYHPVFVVFALLLWGILFYVVRTGEAGLETALAESEEKYACWDRLAEGGAGDASRWLRARERHFVILRRQIRALLIAQIVGPLLLLLAGSVLFSAEQLSLGQFVAIELIGGGLFATLGKLAKFMETQYALLTSVIKIDHAMETGHA